MKMLPFCSSIKIAHSQWLESTRFWNLNSTRSQRCASELHVCVVFQSWSLQVFTWLFGEGLALTLSAVTDPNIKTL